MEIDQVTTFGDLTVRPVELDLATTERVSLDDWGEDDDPATEPTDPTETEAVDTPEEITRP